MSAKCKPNEIRIVRVYEASVQDVWEAWTDPEQVAQWWGPRGFTITTHSKELRPGGSWVYTMHGPDGTDYPNHTIYHEVETCRKLVYDHGANDDRPPLFRVTVTFSEKDGRTTMDMTFGLASKEAATEIKKFIKLAQGNSTWDRLAEYLDKQVGGKDVFVINESFSAPVAVVFAMWTDREAFRQWFPPPGFKTEITDGAIEEGNGISFRMNDGKGHELFGRYNYLKVAFNQELIFEQQFVDEEGQVSRHPLAKDWPATLRTTVFFVQEDEGTRLTLVTEVGDGATSAETAAFLAGRDGMTTGWHSAFDKLEELIAARGALD